MTHYLLWHIPDRYLHTVRYAGQVYNPDGGFISHFHEIPDIGGSQSF